MGTTIHQTTPATTSRWSTSPPKSARFGSIPMRPARSPTPTPVKPSASSLQMASSSRSLLPCTQDLAPVSSQPPEELVDTAVSVNVRVRPTPVCLAKLYGCAVSVSSAVKHKRALVEHIHRAKAEKARERILKEEMDGKRAKVKAARERKQERVAAKQRAQFGDDEETETK